MSEIAPQAESSQTTTQTAPTPPATLGRVPSFLTDSASTFNPTQSNSASRRIPGWFNSAPTQNPLPAGQPFMLNPFFQNQDGTQNRGMGYFPPLDYQNVHNTLGDIHGFNLLPPMVQWPPPMEFHNVTESDMRERGKAAAAAGKSMESPFVINQGLPAEYRQFLPSIPPNSDPSSTSSTPSPFVGNSLPHLFQHLSSPPISGNPYPPSTLPLPQSLPPAPVTNSHQSSAELDQIRASLATARKSNEHPFGHLRTSGEQPSPTVSATPDLTGQTSIGVTDANARSKRLKMFQETSEESFEESLMNGGYGMYRTSDLVPNRDPIPASSPAQTNNTTTPTPISLKDARKRKRLAAFLKKRPGQGNEDEYKKEPEDRLKIVVVEGMGRVLSPVSPSSLYKLPPPPSQLLGQQEESSLPKKRGGYRKRRPKDSNTLEKPDWPDTNFFWRSRTDERERERRFELDEKMKMIHGYLESSDDEDKENEINPESNRPIWRFVALPEGETSFPPVPVDPSDARSVLINKKDARHINDRHKRKRIDDSDADSDDEENQIICLGEDCRRPRSSSRVEVQCDHCYTWFHLACIGVRSAKELGPEEQNWYCDRCDDDLSETPKGLEHLYHPQTDSSPEPEVPYDNNDPSTPSNAFSSSPLYPVTPNSAHRGTETTTTPLKRNIDEWNRPLEHVPEIA